MTHGASQSFGGQLKALREAAGFTQEELATIAGLSVHAVSALERGERKRPQFETVRALAAALDLAGGTRDALLASARASARTAAVDDMGGSLLPLEPTTLLGREADVQTLRSWLNDPGVRLITLTGPGGVGKTRLALAIARAIAAEGITRVVFTPLAAVRNPSFVAPAIAEALGVLESTAFDLPKRVRLACENTPTLLVIDNFEQVVDAAPLLADLLAAAATLRVLATSRASLRVRGEREYAVGPLPLQLDADPTTPADLARCPAVQLFVERVRDVQPRFRLTSANGPTVAGICRRLDALPLAIELAAPWMKTLTADELLRQLARDVLLSPVGPSDLPERQRTMNAAIAWSYQLLGPSERRNFRRLGALPGRFSVEAAAAVLAGVAAPPDKYDDALRATASLIDKSLLLRAELPAATRPLYQMLETVRAYAGLELDAAEERDDALAGLARYCGGEGALAAKELFGAAQAEWLDRIRDDLEGYRGALAWLIERRQGVEAADIAWGLMYFWVIRGHASEGLQWYQQVLTLPSLPPVTASKALVGAAMMWYSLGDLDCARSHLTRALALAAEAGSTEMVAQAEHLSGHVEHAVGNTAVARARFTSSLEGFRALGIPWGTANSLNGLAKVALAVGDTDAAEELLNQATVVLRSGPPFFRALVSFRRATLAVRRGNADEAIAWVRESLALFRQLQDKYAVVYALVPLAAAAVLKGDDLWTARILGARDAVTERTGAMVVDQWVHALGEQAESAVRARLGPDRWARAYAAGRNTSIDSLMRDIDSVRRHVHS